MQQCTTAAAALPDIVSHGDDTASIGVVEKRGIIESGNSTPVERQDIVASGCPRLPMSTRPTSIIICTTISPTSNRVRVRCLRRQGWRD
jgi:hypothetical protein